MEIENFSNELFEVKICSGLNFSDDRGTLKKTIHGPELNNLMPKVSELLCTTSKKNVIRGLHFQKQPEEIAKFITCVKGEIIDVFVDIRKNSKTFGKYGTIKLTERDEFSVFIPEGFAHGFSTLSETSVITYLQSKNYNPDLDSAVNPLSLNIDWKIDHPIISNKDLNAVNFSDL